MVRFRSWCENIKEFSFFEDGTYFSLDKGVIATIGLSSFDWRNAEQSMVINDVVYYVGDIVKRNRNIGVCVLENGKMMLKIKDNLTIGRDYTLYDFNKYGYENNGHEHYSWENKFTKLGNIHEDKELLNEI